MKMGSSIRGALSYNEQKVSNKKAELLLASGFGCDVESLGFSEKLERFQRLNERNQRVRTNTLHLSINFPPEESIDDSKMRQIAVDYMNRIGFGGQPYLVYRHKDTRHHHFHIVTTNIKADAEAIDMNWLGRDKSEPARKAIEIEYGLIVAESRKKKENIFDNHLLHKPIEYGRQETKHAITNIVGMVTQSYKFCSLHELNIILRQFRIVADPGLPGTRRNQKGGLIYSILDSDGYKKGVPIKASDIYGRPTMAMLERKFAANAVKKAGALADVLAKVTPVFKQSHNILQFTQVLNARGISLQVEQNRLGLVDAVHFVDHRKKVTFSHQELGVSLDELYRLRAESINRKWTSETSVRHRVSKPQQSERESFSPGFAALPLSEIIQVLLRPEPSAGDGGGEPPKKKKKKRKGPSI